MSTIKSSAENLTLNADGANNDIKFQSNGTEVASIDQAGNVIAAGGVYVSGELQVTQVANNEAIDVSTNGTTTNAIRVIASALTTGKAAQIYSNSASTGTRNLVEIWNDHADSTGATALYVDNDSTGLAADFQGTGGIRSAGGIKFGTDTAAANALSDYETGAWSPTITGASGSYGLDSSANTAAYTKIGRLVTCQGHISITSDNSASGSLKMSLPFTPSSMGDDQEYAFAHLHLGNTGTTTAGQKQLFILAGGAYLHNVTDGGVVSYLTHTAVDANWQMGFSFTYIAA